MNSVSTSSIAHDLASGGCRVVAITGDGAPWLKLCVGTSDYRGSAPVVVSMFAAANSSASDILRGLIASAEAALVRIDQAIPNAADLATAEEDAELRLRHANEGALVIVGNE